MNALGSDGRPWPGFSIPRESRRVRVVRMHKIMMELSSVEKDSKEIESTDNRASKPVWTDSGE